MSMNYVLKEPKEEETTHQMLEDMELGNKELRPSNIGQDEAHNKHVFY
jgi:hypothetical protein